MCTAHAGFTFFVEKEDVCGQDNIFLRIRSEVKEDWFLKWQNI